MKIDINNAPLNEQIYLWQPQLLVQIVFLSTLIMKENLCFSLEMYF